MNPGTGGDGQKGWVVLQEKYLKATDDTTRAKKVNLAASSLKNEHDPND